MSSAGKAGLIAADAAANLAKGTAQVLKEGMAGTKDVAMDRIAETSGGKIAAAIKASNSPDQMGAAVESAPMFEGNNLAGAGDSGADAAAEIAEFANRDTRFA
jgi:type IV secretion system protein TrbL